MEPMPNRSSKQIPEPDDVATFKARASADPFADSLVDPTTGKNAAAVALGRLGGKRGGRARAAKLSPEQRHEIAVRAAAARWKR